MHPRNPVSSRTRSRHSTKLFTPAVGGTLRSDRLAARWASWQLDNARRPAGVNVGGKLFCESEEVVGSMLHEAHEPFVVRCVGRGDAVSTLTSSDPPCSADSVCPRRAASFRVSAAIEGPP